MRLPVRSWSMFLVVLVALLAGGCSVGDSDEETEDTTPGLRTPEATRTAVWERSYSECASNPLARLAGKYGVDPQEPLVATAVARYWKEQLGGFDDVIASGRDGCRQGFEAQSD